MIDTETVIAKAREIIAEEGKISIHDLTHKICIALDCFGELSGGMLRGMPITNDKYPKFAKFKKDHFVYIKEAPIVEDVEAL